MHLIPHLAVEYPAARTDSMSRLRVAQKTWAQTNLRDRLRVVRRIRTEIARNTTALVNAFPPELRAHPAERLASELVPLLEACRFLEQAAPEVLRSRVLRRKRRPIWVRRICIEEHREPLGVVLIIGPRNYPLFLPAVQALQALTAGNAVAIKPGAGGFAVIKLLSELATAAGLPPELISILEESPENAHAAIAYGVDKVVLTGSVYAGRAIYRTAAENLTPAILELSGDDPVFVLATADLERAADAIAFGLRWNGGDTCIAPKRIFVHEEAAERFGMVLEMKCPEAQTLPVIHFRSEEEALALAERSPFALGASVFGANEEARAFAKKIRAGVVVVNDMIMPTADPHVTFGGRGESGFGRTRGKEGLRQFTAPKVVVLQKARRLRHFEPLEPNTGKLFAAYLALAHETSFRKRLHALRDLFTAFRNR